MKMKNSFFASVLVILTLSAGSAYCENIKADDWLELVKKYTSADVISSDEKSGWDKLVDEYRTKKDKKNDSKPMSEISSEGKLLSEWWKTLSDDVLNELIVMSFRSNRNLEISRSRVIQAREQIGITRSAMNPQSDIEGRYRNGKNSSFTDGTGGSYNDYYLGVDASWELDFFGKRKYDLEASKADLAAEYANLHDSWVSLSAEVATYYVNFRTYQKRIDIARRNINAQEEMLALLESQYKAGLKDGLATEQERYSLEEKRAAIPQLEQYRNSAMNTLALLTGEVPGSLNDMLMRSDTFTPKMDVSRLIGIPAETVRQRPDIRAAEKNLEAQTARRKSAARAMYPTISLTGSIGLESESTGDLFQDISRFFSIGPKITWPLFDGGRIRKNIRVQTEKERELMLNLEQTVLNAVADVRDALDACAKEIIRERMLQEALQSAKAARDIATDKYIQGLSDFSDVLTAQEAVYSLEDDCAQSEANKITNLISLFKALGGSWQPME